MDVETNQQKNNEIKSTSGTSHRLWIVSYIILALVCIAVYFLLQFRVFGLLGTYRSLMQQPRRRTYLTILSLQNDLKPKR